MLRTQLWMMFYILQKEICTVYTRSRDNLHLAVMASKYLEIGGATGTGSINTSPQGDTKTADNVVVDSITGEVIQGTPKSQEGALLQE